MSATQTGGVPHRVFLRSLWRILRARPQTPPSLRDNHLLQVIHGRRSVRRFSQQPIGEDVLQAILEAGRLAPSTVNLQTWSFAVFSAEGWQQHFKRAIPFRAQVAVIILADSHRGRALLPDFPASPLVETTTAVMNASLAAMNMNIAAEALGVSSVMLSETGRTGLLDAGTLREELQLPEGVIPLMTIVFGYAAAGLRPPMPPRLPLDQISFSGAYTETDPQVMQEWMEQMRAGYKAGNPRSSLEQQMQVYRSKIDRAERALEEIIFGGTWREKNREIPGA